jgi:hypothetical protein
LERKIGQLTMENDFLKKALQHFRDHHPPAVVSGADVCLKKSSKRPSRERAVPNDRPEPGRFLPLARTAAGHAGRDGVRKSTAC